MVRHFCLHWQSEIDQKDLYHGRRLSCWTGPPVMKVDHPPCISWRRRRDCWRKRALDDWPLLLDMHSNKSASREESGTTEAGTLTSEN